MSRSHRPAASIVYVSHGRFDLLRRSLAGVVAHTDLPYEVICVDNGSPRAAEELARTVSGARVIRNRRNEGFACGCNQGAACALAPVVVFLNTDAFPDVGWLEPLVQALEPSDVGAVSPIVLNLDGSVQNAGPVVSSDGRTHTYAQGLQRTDPACAFPREIDYANGACMAVRRAAFSEVGGFDAVYTPAYFEDVDICFALRQRGYRSLHVPRSAVKHARGSSFDPASAHGIAARNLKIFARRWRRELATRPRWKGPLDEFQIVAARDALATSRVLVILDDDGTRAAARVELLGEIRAWHPYDRLTCACPPGSFPPMAAQQLVDAGVELVVLPVRRIPGMLRARRRHYDAVIVAEGARATVASALTETHPAAAIVDEPRQPDSAQLTALLARLGVGRGLSTRASLMRPLPRLSSDA